MRFYEFESRRLVERAGIPVTEYGFCTSAEQAREAAADRCREALAAAGLKGPALLARVDEQDPTWKEEQETRIQAFRTSVKTALQDLQIPTGAPWD